MLEKVEAFCCFITLALTTAIIIRTEVRRRKGINKMPEGDPLPACALHGNLVCPYIVTERDCESCEYGNGGYFLDAEEFAELLRKLGEAFAASAASCEEFGRNVHKLADLTKEAEALECEEN